MSNRTRLMYRCSPEMFFGKVLPRGPKIMGGTVRYLAAGATPEAIAEALKDAVLEHVEIEPERRIVKVYLSVPRIEGAETNEADHPIELHQEWLR